MQKYPLSTIAKLLNLSERRVQQLTKDGIIPKCEKGNYDLVGSVRGYVKYLSERAFGQNSDSIDSHAEKARLLKAQADKAEMELEIMQDKHMTCEEVDYLWSGLIIAFRSKMLGLPTKLARQLAASHGNIQNVEAILQDEIHSALSELSKHAEEQGDREQYKTPATLTSSQENSTAAEAESQPVGG